MITTSRLILDTWQLQQEESLPKYNLYNYKFLCFGVLYLKQCKQWDWMYFLRGASPLGPIGGIQQTSDGKRGRNRVWGGGALTLNNFYGVKSSIICYKFIVLLSAAEIQQCCIYINMFLLGSHLHWSPLVQVPIWTSSQTDWHIIMQCKLSNWDIFGHNTNTNICQRSCSLKKGFSKIDLFFRRTCYMMGK